MTAMRLLRVNVFPGGFNWPLFAARDLGFFTREGIEIALQETTGSIAQMTDFAKGNFDIAMTGFDNIVAYVEGQGEAPIGAQPEFFAFLGSDNSFLSLAAQPEIAGIDSLREQKVSVDAATTGYAFVLYDLLERVGLERGDYSIVKAGGMAQRFDALCRGEHAATMLSTPYDLMAEKSGLKILARVEFPYQGNVAAARRAWACANEGSVLAYIRAYVSALRWLREPANREQACDILQRNVPGITPALTAASYRAMIGTSGGFSSDGSLDGGGVKKVLRLRSRYAEPKRMLDDQEKYADLRYWKNALQNPIA
jgi:ABC-type nitrate/sulfonate/bicarbonate transport system substrate-binding protein